MGKARLARELAGLSVGSNRVALFDLDRTLVAGSSLAYLGRALCEQGLLSRRALVRHLATNAAFARRGLGDVRTGALRERLVGAVAGLESEPLRAVARDVGPIVAAAAYPAARTLLERHLEIGDLCVIVSASPFELVDAVARSLGAHRAVGTRLESTDGVFTGRLNGPFCYGPGKLARLCTDIGLRELNSSTAYADSASDLPLLQAAGHPVAVNPDRKLRDVARRFGWPIVRVDTV